MRHRKSFNRLGRKASHRNALVGNMMTSLFRYERITTTKAKALEVRRNAEKMITRAKEDSVHNRRIVAKRIRDGGIIAKLFTEIGPRFSERPGGYTRILKLNRRPGDASEMVILELLDRKVEPAPKKKKKKEKATVETEQPKEAATEEDVQDEMREEAPEREESEAEEETEVST